VEAEGRDDLNLDEDIDEREKREHGLRGVARDRVEDGGKSERLIEDPSERGDEKGNEHQHWVGKASDEKKNAVKVAPEVLSKYVGTYEEQPKYWREFPRVVEITVEGDTLYGNMDGRGKVPLTAQADTKFSGLNGLGAEFTKGADGAMRLFVKHVSGDYLFTLKK